MFDYTIHRKDRSDGIDPHGGVLIALRRNVDHVRVDLSTNLETMAVDIVTLTGSRFRIIAVYRPGSYDNEQNRLLMQNLYYLTNDQEKTSVFGDFNLPDINWNEYTAGSGIAHHFLNYVLEHNFVQHVNIPTRNENILDLCMSSADDVINNLRVDECFSTSDHNIITCEINIPNPILDNNNKIKVRSFKNTDWDLLRADIACMDWPSMLSPYFNDPDSMWDILRKVFDRIYQIYIPEIEIRPNRDAPWLTENIKRMKRTRKRKWRVFRNNPNRQNRTSYQTCCKAVKKSIEEARKSYERKKFSEKNVDARALAKYIEKKMKPREPIPYLVSNGRHVTNNAEKASILSAQYSSVFSIDNDVMPEIQIPEIESQLDIFRVCENDVLLAIRKMNPSSAPGADGIHPRVIKELSAYLIKPLTFLFTSILETSVVPQEWKLGIITPTLKARSEPHLAKSYRPICLTSVVSKLFESVVHGQIMEHLYRNNILCKAQHGFLNKRSTNTNLLSCWNDWTLARDKKRSTDVIYTDLEKAFDKVVHSKLLYKIESIGIIGSAHRLLGNYLQSRIQKIKVENNLSDPAPVTSGIPQGTLLGPLFFVIFINDLPGALSPNSTISLYADDAKVYKDCVTLFDCLTLYDDIQALNDWFVLWQLKINLSKCEVLHIGPSNPKFSYFIGDEYIRKADSIRDLGLLTSPDLSSSQHCTEIARRAHYRLYQLNRCFENRDRDFRLYLFKTYVRPILECDTIIWSPKKITDIDKIERTLRRFTKYLPEMFHTPFMERLQALGLETLEERRIKNDLIFLFKIIHRLVDVPFESLFSWNERPSRGHILKINCQYSRTDIRKYFFVTRVVPVWNNLPAIIVNSENLNRFKNALNVHNFSNLCRGRAYRV